MKNSSERDPTRLLVCGCIKIKSIADWYNPIIQHGEVDFRDPRRDHTHGRIWRVTAKNRPLVPHPKLVEATVPELLEQR